MSETAGRGGLDHQPDTVDEKRFSGVTVSKFTRLADYAQIASNWQLKLLLPMQRVEGFKSLIVFRKIDEWLLEFSGWALAVRAMSSTGMKRPRRTSGT